MHVVFAACFAQLNAKTHGRTHIHISWTYTNIFAQDFLLLNVVLCCKLGKLNVQKYFISLCLIYRSTLYIFVNYLFIFFILLFLYSQSILKNLRLLFFLKFALTSTLISISTIISSYLHYTCTHNKLGHILFDSLS